MNLVTPPEDPRALAILALVDTSETTVSESFPDFSEAVPVLGEADGALDTMDYPAKSRPGPLKEGFRVG